MAFDRVDLLEAYQQSNAFGKDNGLELKVIASGHIEYTMPLQQRHMALPDVVHGGVIAGLMDAVLSVAAFSAVAGEGMQVATVEFKINYLLPAKGNGFLKGIGKVIKKGKRLVIAEGEIYGNDGELLAIAQGTMAAYDPKS